MILFGVFTVSATSFSPRYNAPSSSDSYFYSLNPFYNNGYGMPNCTCYAYGRAYELLGTEPNLSRGNAGYWWWYNKSNRIYSYGSTPKLGAIACWDKYDQNQGHVAVVEAIDGNSVTISESHYSGTYFDTRTINSNSSNYLTSMRFLGYIYIGDFEDEPVKNAWLNINRSEIVTGESIVFSFGAENGNGLYTIGIDKGGVRIYTTDTWNDTFSYTFNESGDYSAYITAYGNGTLSDSNRVYFKVYPNVPASNAWLTIDKELIETGQSINFTFDADNSAGIYTIGIDKNNERIHTEDIRSNSFTYTFNEAGNYSAYVTCYGYGGLADTQRVYFIVTDFTPINKGDGFYAKLIHNTSSKVVSVSDDYNVKLFDYDSSDDSLWRFQRMNDCSYRITNAKTNRCLDVYMASSENNTNIQAFPVKENENESGNQLWYFRSNGTGFSLVPKCAITKSVDLYDGNSGYDNNLSIYSSENNNSNQIFSLNHSLSPSATEYFNGNKYELYSVPISWNNAYKFCEQKGGHLVTITSQEEQDFISAFTQSNSGRVWLGATDELSEGTWKWVTGEDVKYNNFYENEPNNDGNEDYLTLYRDSGKWVDVQDNYYQPQINYSFICEYDCDKDVSSIKSQKHFSLNGHYYELYSNIVDWQTAKRICEQKGGHLVTISSAEENDYIYTNIAQYNTNRFWIGLSDIKLVNQWEWVTGEKCYYSNWYENEPSNAAGIECYVEILADNGTWNDAIGYNCSHMKNGFICEYDNAIGDTNLDGNININDVTAIQRHLAEIELLTEVQLDLADTNGDGEINISDATHLQKYLAGFDGIVLGKS